MYDICYIFSMEQERLKQLLDYDPWTGNFKWREHRANVKAGQLAGHLTKMGYRTIRIDKKMYLAHRLAWLYTHGTWPTVHIDHVNGTPGDDRIINLRLATHSENMRNRKDHSNNSSGFKGVSWHKGAKKWAAGIRIHGRRKHLGLFDAAEAAHLAYCEAAKALHGSFSRVSPSCI